LSLQHQNEFEQTPESEAAVAPLGSRSRLQRCPLHFCRPVHRRIIIDIDADALPMYARGKSSPGN